MGCKTLSSIIGEPLSLLKLRYVREFTVYEHSFKDELNMLVTLQYDRSWLMRFRLMEVSLRLTALANQVDLAGVTLRKLPDGAPGAGLYEIMDHLRGHTLLTSDIVPLWVRPINGPTTWLVVPHEEREHDAEASRCTAGGDRPA